MENIADIVRATDTEGISEGDKVKRIAEALSGDIYRSLLGVGIDHNYLVDDRVYRAIERYVALALLIQHNCDKRDVLEADIAADNKRQRALAKMIAASWLPLPDNFNIPPNALYAVVRTQQKGCKPVVTAYLVPPYYSREDLKDLGMEAIIDQPNESRHG
jgi:hypothetical protein